MAVKQLIKLLKHDNTVIKTAKNYQEQGRTLTHIVRYNPGQLEALVSDMVTDVATETIPEAFTSSKMLVKNQKLIKDTVSAVFSKRNITSAVTQAGFKVFPTRKAADSAYGKGSRKKAVIEQVGTDVLVILPTAVARRGKHSKSTAVLPGIHMRKGKEIDGFSYPLLDQAIDVFFQKFGATIKKHARGLRLEMGSEGGAYGRTKLDAQAKHARRLHGGEYPGPNRELNIGRPGGTIEEGSTASLVGLVERLKQGKYEDFAKRLLKGSSAASYIDNAFDDILGKLDIFYSINSNSISDIVKNNKNIEVVVTIGPDSNQPLMDMADKGGLDVVLEGIESALIQAATNVNMETSRSMKDMNVRQARKIIVEKALKEPLTKAGAPDMRFKVNKRLLQEGKVYKEKGTGKFKFSLAAQVTKEASKLGKKTYRAKKSTGRYDKNTTNSTTSLANLMQMINAELPRFLKTNMTPPRLQYRGKGNPSKPFAGPFNTGVQVTSLTDSKSNAGGINVNYTYEKYPYQTFEPGFEQGSTLRDPRELIKESIRQIMITNKQNRFLRFRRH